MATAPCNPAPRPAADSSTLSERDFARIAGIVSKHTGIKLPASKHLMLEGRLRRRAGLAGFASLDEYCD